MNIGPSSIIVLNKFFLQNKKVFGHFIIKLQSRVRKGDDGIKRKIRAPSKRFTFNKGVNNLALNEELSRKSLEKINGLRESNIAKFESLRASKLKIEE